MKNVFLDSNIFIKENYLQGKYIKALLKLGQDSIINIYIHDIILGEVKSNFKIHLETSLKAYREFHKNKAKYLRNVRIGKSIVTYDKLKIEELHKEFCDTLEQKLLDANVQKIPFYNVNIESIFKDYFGNTAPFGLKEEKKHGFPDAFLVEFIKKWVVDNQKSLVILTADNDFSHINNYQNLIEVQGEHRIFVDEINKEIIREKELKELKKFRIQKVDEIIENDTQNIKIKTQEYIEDYLYDESIYYPLVNTEVHDLSNLQFSEIIDLETFLVEIFNEEEIEVEISFKLKFTIDILTDDESFSHYDSEDKIMHYFDTVTIEGEGICIINTSVILSIIDKEDFEEEVDLDLDKDDFTIEVYSNDEIY